jgi:hypothetical protein
MSRPVPDSAQPREFAPPARRDHRRPGIIVLAVAVVGALLGGLTVVVATRDGPAASAAAGEPPRPADGTGQSPRAAAAATGPHADPFSAAMTSYLAGRAGMVTAAVYDLRTGQTWTLGHGQPQATASIVKVDILETLLHRTGGHLSEDQRETAKSMIENSNNDSATDLWNQDGGAPGVDAYNDDLGLTQTAPNEDWGLTTTSASDQVALVRELFHRSSLLTTSARHFERMLMRHVEADQRWGISGGVPSNAVVGNKNGWLPVNADHDRWVVNSIGWVHGDRKSYVIAVITQHDANEDYGIDTIQHIARLVWDHATVAHSK